MIVLFPPCLSLCSFLSHIFYTTVLAFTVVSQIWIYRIPNFHPVLGRNFSSFSIAEVGKIIFLSCISFPQLPLQLKKTHLCNTAQIFIIIAQHISSVLIIDLCLENLRPCVNLVVHTHYEEGHHRRQYPLCKCFGL